MRRLHKPCYNMLGRGYTATHELIRSRNRNQNFHKASLGEITLMSAILNSSSCLTPSIITQSLPQDNAIRQFLRPNPSSNARQPFTALGLDACDADAVAGKIEAFEGAVFLQGCRQHLAVSNHHRARTCSPHRSTQPQKCWPCDIFTNPNKTKL